MNRAASSHKIKKAMLTEAKGIGYLLPSLAILIVFTIYPMINSFVVSFYNWNLTGKKKYIGIYNYQKLFKSDEFWQVLGNTMQYLVIVLPATMILGFLIALLLRKTSKLNVVFRTMIFTPHVTSLVGLSVIWLFIYNPQYGILNTVLSAIGLTPLRWVNDASTALLSLSIITIWRMLGYSVIVYLGGIQNISEEIIEAAHIDGASKAQVAWHIMVPLVSSTTFMLLILNTINIIKLFTTINTMTNGGPGNSTANLVVMLYNYAFRTYQVGYASAISVILFLLILIINVLEKSFERFVTYDI